MLNPIEGLDENFKFLALEVNNQVASTQQFLKSPSRSLNDKIVSRDDYIDNLKNIIENKCFSRIHGDRELTKQEINRIRSAQIICVNLERIADFCVNIVRQVGYLRDQNFLSHVDFNDMFRQIEESLQLVIPCQNKGSLAEALAICRSEFELDQLYKKHFDQIMAELRIGQNVENLITILFIARYLERIGDSMLNIGEALIFAIIGEKIKIEQFQALQQTLSKSGIEASMADIDFQSIWGTKSGCRISRVSSKDNSENPAQGGIFKEGNAKKIRREKENIESWATIYPGLGPRVFSYHEEGETASMLVEFLSGCTMDQVLLASDEAITENAFFLLEHTLDEIWKTTRVNAKVPTDSMSELNARLDSVLQVHPSFQRAGQNMGATNIPSTAEVISACKVVEAELPAPFTVFTHGDFNLNNVVYNHANQSIHFIDLYRSGRSDYLRDVAVFIVSNFRVPVFEKDLRERLNRAIAWMFNHSQRYATENGDPTFQARLALALGRSFYTSTRFELNHDFANEMYLRSIYILEKILRHQGQPWEEFELPLELLFY